MIKYLAAAIFAITMIGLIYVAVAEQDPPNSGDAASDVSLVNSGVEASSGNVLSLIHISEPTRPY